MSAGPLLFGVRASLLPFGISVMSRSRASGDKGISKYSSTASGKLHQGHRRWASWLSVVALMATTAMLLVLNPVLVSRPSVSIPQKKAIELSSGEAYFQFDYPPNPETFIFALSDPDKIQEARDILNGRRPSRHIMGKIVKVPADYNPPWSYYLDPPSITFFDFAIEVCDAAIQQVELHLNEACGSFLPGCVWCPWGSRLIAEVGVSATPTATPTQRSTPSTTARPSQTPTATPTKTPTPTPTATPQGVLYLPIILSSHGAR